jgi:hypothetical protein
MLKRKKRLLVLLGLLAGWLGGSAWLRAEVDEATAKRVKEVIAAVEAATRPIIDLSCTLEYSQSGGLGREYLENQIRKWEILKRKGITAGDRADKEIAEARASLKKPQAAEEIYEVSKWMMRFDGLFHVNQKHTYAGGSTIEMAFDGRETRFYDRKRENGYIQKGAAKAGFTPQFGWSVNYEPLAECLARALREGSVQISDEPAQGADKIVKLTVVFQSDHETGRSPLVASLFHSWSKTRKEPVRTPQPQEHRAAMFARIWLNVSKNHLPIRMEWGYPFGKTPADWLVGSITEIKGQEILPGVWYPVECRNGGAMIANLADAEQPLENWKLVAFPNPSMTKVKLRDIVVNQNLKKELFTIDYPAGTQLSVMREAR